MRRDATAAHNLGRVLWKLLGVGKPRSLQGRGVAAEESAVAWSAFWRALTGRPERNAWLPQRIAVACQILDSAVTLAV